MNQPNTAKTQTGFNLFAFLHGEDVYALGATRHDENLTEAEMLTFLQMAVPHDAIAGYRQGFKVAPCTTALSDGTVALPGHLFGKLQRTGQVLGLFEGIFQRFDAPEDPLMCFTIVRDGVPVNDDGPIYHGGARNPTRASVICTSPSNMLPPLPISPRPNMETMDAVRSWQWLTRNPAIQNIAM